MSNHFPGTHPLQGEAGEGKDEGGELYGQTKTTEILSSNGMGLSKQTW